MLPPIDQEFRDAVKDRTQAAREAISAEAIVGAVQAANKRLHEASVGTGQRMSKEEIAAAKVFMDGAKLLLSKALPDLKAVEHSVGDGTLDLISELGRARERAAAAANAKP